MNIFNELKRWSAIVVMYNFTPYNAKFNFQPEEGNATWLKYCFFPTNLLFQHKSRMERSSSENRTSKEGI